MAKAAERRVHRKVTAELLIQVLSKGCHGALGLRCNLSALLNATPLNATRSITRETPALLFSVTDFCMWGMHDEYTLVHGWM